MVGAQGHARDGLGGGTVLRTDAADATWELVPGMLKHTGIHVSSVHTAGVELMVLCAW